MDRFLRHAGGRFLLLMDEGGTPLLSRGTLPEEDPSALASLASAHFGAGRQLASSLGDPDLTALVQQGSPNGLVLLRLGEGAILALGLEGGSGRGRPGKVLSGQVLDDLAGTVARALGEVASAHDDAGVEGWANEAESHIDRIFGEGA